MPVLLQPTALQTTEVILEESDCPTFDILHSDVKIELLDMSPLPE